MMKKRDWILLTKFSRDATAERFSDALGEALRYRVAAKLGGRDVVVFCRCFFRFRALVD